jgi:hypothetical protein
MPWSVGNQEGLIRTLQRSILKVHLQVRQKSVKNAIIKPNFEEKLDKTQWTIYLWSKNVENAAKTHKTCDFDAKCDKMQQKSQTFAEIAVKTQ